MSNYHRPVLLEESVTWMDLHPGGTYVDVTFGGGGHSKEILKRLDGQGRLFALDQDSEAAANAEADSVFSKSPNFEFLPANFRYMERVLWAEGVQPGTVDGILADLGVSSYQIDTPERGFSHRFDAPLDMRMNPKSGGKTAADVLNTYSAADLHRVFGEFGEVRNAKTLAQVCVDSRAQMPFTTTGRLIDLLGPLSFGNRVRYLSQVFQALRIEVNDEMAVLQEFLEGCKKMLKPGSGKVVILSYHSLEDKLVKNFFKTGTANGEPIRDFYGNIERPFEILTKKAIEVSEAEIKENPRARSVKMRAAMLITNY